MTAGSSWLSNRAAIAGIGHTAFGKTGEFAHLGPEHLAVEAIAAACDDAGISPSEIDGFSCYLAPLEPGDLAASFGCRRLRYTAQSFGGGGGAMAVAYLNAAMAVATGQADHVIVYKALVAPRTPSPPPPDHVFHGSPYSWPQGLLSPGMSFALGARRYMHRYGATIEDFGHVAINARRMAHTNPRARFRDLITMDDHHNSPTIADPLRLLDFCMQSELGAAVLVTTAERARDLRQPPILIAGAAVGAGYRWGQGMFGGFNMDDDDFASSGQSTVADDVYSHSGIGPGDVDVLQVYDHFTAMVLMEIEAFGFCKAGEGGAFVADGHTLMGGSVPMNTSGGNLAECYGHGIIHVIEGVRQLRGVAVNQVPDAETCLVVAGSSPAPSSAMILTRQP